MFGTVQRNIVGESRLDQRYYDRIVKPCSLQLDFQQLPFGDQTKVGVNGSRLSGGQQMRVVGALHVLIITLTKSCFRHWRELSTQGSLFYFWMTPLSVLIVKQRSAICKLFSRSKVSSKMRRQTAILATNLGANAFFSLDFPSLDLTNIAIAHHLPYAYFIISLSEDGRIVEQGSYDDLAAAKGYVSNLTSTSTTVNTERPPDVVLDDETLQV